jgi:hypothetical protein
MKTYYLWFFVCTTTFAAAQMPTKPELLQAFRDADYVFKQFDNLTQRVTFSHWRAEDSLVNGSKEALETIRNERNKTGITLSRLYSEDYISPVDLLDLMSGVSSVGTELDHLGDGVLNFQDEGSKDITLISEKNELAKDLVRASNSAELSSATIYVLTRRILVLQEQVVFSCVDPKGEHKVK